MIFEKSFSVDMLIFSEFNWSSVSQIKFYRSLEISLFLRNSWKSQWTFLGSLCLVLFQIGTIKIRARNKLSLSLVKMLSIRVAEIDLIRAWLEILGNSSLECIASKKSATLSSWYFRRSAVKSPSSTIIFFFGYFLKVLNENDC